MTARAEKPGPVLTPAQVRLLHELAEPNSNPENEWGFPAKNRRTLLILVALGFAKYHDRTFDRGVYSITCAGREELARVRARGAK